jgi:hypothetical protein
MGNSSTISRESSRRRYGPALFRWRIEGIRVPFCDEPEEEFEVAYVEHRGPLDAAGNQSIKDHAYPEPGLSFATLSFVAWKLKVRAPSFLAR